MTWAIDDHGHSFLIAGSYAKDNKTLSVEAHVTTNEYGSSFVIIDEDQGEVIAGWNVDAEKAKSLSALHAQAWLRGKQIDEKPSWSYVGCKWCGCIVAAYVEDPDPKRRKDLGREVGKWIADGLTVQRMLSEAIRVKWIGADCDHGEAPGDQMKLF